MKKPLKVFALVAILVQSLAFQTSNASPNEQESFLYGTNHLRPSPDSLIGRYLSKTKAYSFSRSFKKSDGTMGPERLVVLVSKDSFPTFKKYFSHPTFLYQLHDPRNQNLILAFKGVQGSKARLTNEFAYGNEGSLAIPLMLAPSEWRRADRFFRLALEVPANNDFLLYPWRLLTDKNEAYCATGDETSLVDWFTRMPLGKAVKDSKKTLLEYQAPHELAKKFHSALHQVWTASYGRESLAKTLRLDYLESNPDLKTPSQIALELLGSASIQRLPVVFRFTYDHVSAIPHDFDPATTKKALNDPQTAKNLKVLANQMYGDDLSAPSKESLVGQYLAETGASWTMRSFPNSSPGSTLPVYQLGPQKLVVSVNAKTWPVFLKYFSSSNFLFHIHNPNQGTIINAFEGKYGTYAQLGTDLKIARFSYGTLVIPVLLDSSEGDRARNFFKLANINNGYALTPNALQDRTGTPYCSSDYYRGCTHWFGDMPIGNETVDAYVFPSGDAKGEKPNTKFLTSYNLANFRNSEEKQLINEVWSVPGHKQLGQLIAPESHLRGELANPGWVAYTLIGTVETDRVPVVFWYQDDEKKSIPGDFRLLISEH